jgi:hypothetical protein
VSSSVAVNDSLIVISGVSNVWKLAVLKIFRYNLVPPSSGSTSVVSNCAICPSEPRVYDLSRAALSSRGWEPQDRNLLLSPSMSINSAFHGYSCNHFCMNRAGRLVRNTAFVTRNYCRMCIKWATLWPQKNPSLFLCTESKEKVEARDRNVQGRKTIK